MTDYTQDIEECLLVLEKGGIILYPTDTVWGIGCDATDAAAVEKIYSLKKRPDNKAMIVLVPNEKDILRYVAAPDPGIIDHLRKLMKPTTVVYPGAIGLAENLTGLDGTIAIRICNDSFCKQLLLRCRNPIVSTSANRSGQPVPSTFKEIPAEIKNGVDYIVQYRQDDASSATPSSVLKWNNDGTFTVLRQ